MPGGLSIGTLAVVIVVAIFLLNWVKILNEYERGVVFRLGNLIPRPKGPGLVLVFAPFDRMVKVSLRLVALDVPPQDIITKDNVSVKVNAVVFFRVVEPIKAIVEVENFLYATSQLAQTTLRSILGQAELDDLLAECPTDQHPYLFARSAFSLVDAVHLPKDSPCLSVPPW